MKTLIKFFRYFIKYLLFIFIGTCYLYSQLNPVKKNFPNSLNNMTKAMWLEDFDSLYQTMRKNYPLFEVKERQFGYNWLEQSERFRKRIEDAKTEYECLEILFDVITALQNGHSSIVNPKDMKLASKYYYSLAEGVEEYNKNWLQYFDEYYKKNNLIEYDADIFYESGQYYIRGGKNNWDKKYGYNSQIIKVNGLQIDSAILLGFEKNHLHYDFKRRKPYISKITPKLFGNDAIYEIIDTNGISREIRFEVIPNNNLLIPYEWDPTKERIVFRRWPNKKVAYIWIYDFIDNRDHDTLINIYKDVADYKL